MVAGDKPNIVVVQGPTACGKTGLAIRIAQTFGGEIVNADSVQFVRHFDIGSAKPTAEERRAAVHHLVDAVEPDAPYDAAEYARRAHACITEILERKRLPVVSGGTGLYVRALLGGLVELPKRNESLRAKYAEILETSGVAALFSMLEDRAPEAGEYIDRHNPPRVVRALEVLEMTGRPIWKWQREHRFRDRPYRALVLALKPDFAALEERIRLRTRDMLEAGLVREVQKLLERFPDRNIRAYGSIGYRQALEFLDGKTAEAELEESIVRATRRYAKKQLSWLNTEPDVRWCDPENEAEILARAAAFLSE